MRHAVYPRPAKRRAPPTPPTTPPIVALVLELKPELPPPELPPDSDAGSTSVSVGTTVSDVLVETRVWPSTTDVMVTCTWDVIDVWMRVREVADDAVVSSEDCDVSSLEVCDGVLVEVVKVVVRDCEVDVSVAVVGVAEVGAAVGVVVSSSVVVSVVVTPVLKGTFCRLKRAMALSRGSDTACEASRDDTRATAAMLKCLMMMVLLR
jgi:hypothetical protein